MRLDQIARAAIRLAAIGAANDSTAAIGIGGLTLTRSAEIRLDQQELFVSRTQIRVNYLFTNTGAQDIETLVAFPLPDFTHSPVERVPDYRRELNFRTLVEGRPVQYEIMQRARLRDRDITDRLRGLGLPLVAEELVLGDTARGRTTNFTPGRELDVLIVDFHAN